jgi:hypothetical protein
VAVEFTSSVGREREERRYRQIWGYTLAPQRIGPIEYLGGHIVGQVVDFDLNELMTFIDRSAVLDETRISLLRHVGWLEQEVQKLAQDRAALPSVSHAAVHDLGHGWMLDRPIWATVEEYSDQVVARVPELNAYGSGASEQEAIEDLRDNMVELRTALEGLEPGSELAERWQRLLRRATEVAG